MGNRKQPFGYRMEMGEIVTDPPEADVVRYIFREYIAGATFNSLTAALKCQPVAYDQGKLWNKNMVARILEDRRYAGEKEYPVIICQADIDAAEARRASRQQPIQKTEAQKVLRQLSGHTATPNMERQTLDLLNSVIGRPEKITSPTQQHSDNVGISIRQQLDTAMGQQPIDEDRAKDLIFELAAEQYAAIGSEEYETVRLRRLFTTAEPMETLDAKLLRSAVSAIQILGNGAVVLRLKNHQILGGERE